MMRRLQGQHMTAALQQQRLNQQHRWSRKGGATQSRAPAAAVAVAQRTERWRQLTAGGEGNTHAAEEWEQAGRVGLESKQQQQQQQQLGKQQQQQQQQLGRQNAITQYCE